MAITEELNPNHPVVNTLRDHWNIIAGLMLRKLAPKGIIITEQDIREANENKLYVCVNDRADGLHIYLVTEEEAKALARKEGGLPT